MMGMFLTPAKEIVVNVFMRTRVNVCMNGLKHPHHPPIPRVTNPDGMG